MKNATISIICAIGLISSCVQRYTPPPVATPKVESWKTKQSSQIESPECPEPEQVLVEAAFRPWWKVFQDPTLDTLEYGAIKESPTVRASVARLEEAMAQYGITRSQLFPEITLDVSASRQRISKTQNFAGTGAGSGAGGSSSGVSPTGGSVVAKGPCSVLPPGKMAPTFGPVEKPAKPVPPMCKCPPPPAPPKPITHITSLSVLPTLTYHPDFWGKYWQATQAAYEDIKAQQEDLQNTLLQLTTNVADAYMQVRTFDREIDILNSTLRTRRYNYKLNRQQFAAGLINDLAVEQAKSDLENVAAAIENTKRLRALQEHRLAELVGEPASTFTLETLKRWDALLPEIRAGIPSSMLQRRPDIRMALAQIESARLNVGVAKTEYFPDFTITLDYGFQSSKANKLFKWKSHVWLAAVDAVTPIFTAGRISSTIERAIAQYKQTLASYLDTVLIAFQQAEDSLVSIDATKKQLMHLKLDVAASKKAYTIADKRYRMGLENYLTVVNTERTLLDVEREEIQVKRDQYSNIISLINSLGGYWNNNEEVLSALTK